MAKRIVGNNINTAGIANNLPKIITGLEAPSNEDKNTINLPKIPKRLIKRVVKEYYSDGSVERNESTFNPNNY